MSDGTTDGTFRELQSTIDVLTARLVDKDEVIEQLEAEVERLEEKLNEAEKDATDNLAEIERLRAKLGAGTESGWIDEIERLRARIERLLSALDYVYERTFCGIDGEWHFKPGYDPQRVIDALAGKEGVIQSVKP